VNANSGRWNKEDATDSKVRDTVCAIWTNWTEGNRVGRKKKGDTKKYNRRRGERGANKGGRKRKSNFNYGEGSK
jgi:hypothetical protein